MMILSDDLSCTCVETTVVYLRHFFHVFTFFIYACPFWIEQERTSTRAAVFNQTEGSQMTEYPRSKYSFYSSFALWNVCRSPSVILPFTSLENDNRISLSLYLNGFFDHRSQEIFPNFLTSTYIRLVFVTGVFRYIFKHSDG